MSKVATVVGTGFAGSGISLGGAYMLGAFGGGGDGMVLSQKLSQFKEEGNKHCVNGYFSGLKLEGGSSAKLEQSFFTTSSDPKPQTKSCLIVNGEKQTYDNEDKGKGNFRGLGTLVRGDRGFVIFTSADAQEDITDSKLNLTGGIYFVKKENNKWQTDKYQEIPTVENNKKQISDSDFDTKFPSVGEAITEKDKFGTNKDHWGFVLAKSDLGKICSKADSDKCQEQKSKSKEWFRGRWEGESNTDAPQKKITDWSKNGNT